METMKVKPWSKDQGDYVLINVEDFDADVHDKFEDEPKPARRGRQAKDQ